MVRATARSLCAACRLDLPVSSRRQRSAASRTSRCISMTSRCNSRPVTPTCISLTLSASKCLKALRVRCSAVALRLVWFATSPTSPSSTSLKARSKAALAAPRAVQQTVRSMRWLTYRSLKTSSRSARLSTPIIVAAISTINIRHSHANRPILVHITSPIMAMVIV